MANKLRQFYETGNPVNEDPLICVFEDFLSAEEISHLLAAAESKLKQALVSAATSGVESAGRSGQNCWIPHAQDSVVEELALRVAEVVGMGLEHAESFQVVHYAQHQEYAPHYDAWDAATERGQRCMAKGGQRLVTCLFYLVEPEQGGGTCFPNLDMEVRAKKGRMVLFHNCHEGSAIRHKDSLHGGMPVESGEKWACNLWFREKEYRDPGSVPSRKNKSSANPKFSRVI